MAPLSLADATMFLVGVSAVAILAQIGIYWRSKLSRERGRKAKAFRMALIEQLDQCRRVVTHPPREDPPGFDGLIDFIPRFFAVDNVLEEVTLQKDVVNRLLWQMERARLEWEAFRQVASPWSARSREPGTPEFGPSYRHAVFYLQCIGLIIRAAGLSMGLVEEMEPFRGQPWLDKPVLPVNELPVLEQMDRAQRSAPPWPSGHHAFRDSDPMRSWVQQRTSVPTIQGL
jgi:hypothetical protein